MKNIIQNLLILLPVTMLLSCDPADLSKSNQPAQSVSQNVPTLTGEALYTSDKAPDSMLYDKPQQVIEGVWSAIGATSPARYENSGHNNNLSFVITTDGVLVVNAGANYLLAKALHTEIKKITEITGFANLCKKKESTEE